MMSGLLKSRLRIENSSLLAPIWSISTWKNADPGNGKTPLSSASGCSKPGPAAPPSRFSSHPNNWMPLHKPRQFMKRKNTVKYFLVILSVISTLLSTIANALFAASARHGLPEIQPLAFFAVGCSSITFVMLCLLTLLFAKKMEGDLPSCPVRKGRTLVVMGGFLCASGVVTAAALGWSNTQLSANRGIQLHKDIRKFFFVWCGTWGVSATCQGAFFSLVVCPYNNPLHRREAVCHINHGYGAASVTNSPYQPSESTNPHSPDSGRLSQRHSLDKGYWHPCSNLRSSCLAWPEDPPPQRSPSTLLNKVRDTSPQSRSHGDTPSLYADGWVQLPRAAYGGPVRSEAALNRRSSLPQFSTPAPPRSAPCPLSRQSEDHIHPLFRSNSPTPPPTPTPGTIVTAAPTAGQTISMHDLEQIKCRSPQRAHAPLPHFDVVSTEKEVEVWAERKYDQSPIPGFVMSAGIRSSVVDYLRRTKSSTSL